MGIIPLTTQKVGSNMYRCYKQEINTIKAHNETDKILKKAAASDCRSLLTYMEVRGFVKREVMSANFHPS